MPWQCFELLEDGAILQKPAIALDICVSFEYANALRHVVVLDNQEVLIQLFYQYLPSIF